MITYFPGDLYLGSRRKAEENHPEQKMNRSDVKNDLFSRKDCTFGKNYDIIDSLGKQNNGGVFSR